MAKPPLKLKPGTGAVLAGGAKPEGMSQLFWDTINASPEAEKIRKDPLFRAAGDDNAVRQAIDALIAKKWAATPPEKQKQWAHQDEIGSIHPPDTPGWRAEQRVTEAGEIADLNDAEFKDFDEGVFADLKQVAADAAAGNTEAIAKLQAMVDNAPDPIIKEYIGDYISQAAQAGPSQQAMDDQRKEYLKMSGLTDPTITAEERLMQMTARREQEQDLKAQRGAFANDLQARGMYGSGAELTMNLAASQEAAQRRAYDEMQAQANAQTRAMDALVGAADIAGNIRESEAQESQFRGTAADKASEFNKTLKDAYDKWVTKTNYDAGQNKVQNQLGVTGQILTGNRDAVTGAGGIAGTGQAAVATRTGNRTAGFRTVGETVRDLRNEDLWKEGEPLRANTF